MKKIEYEKDVLENAIKESCSYRQVATKLGRGQPTDAFRKYIQNSGIDISHFTKSYPGSSKYLNYTGKQFGYLLVEEVICVKRPLHSNYYAKCTCKCGNKIETLMCSLTRGATRSCGCLKKEYSQTKRGVNNHNYKGVGAISSSTFNGIKGSAKNRNLEFDLDKQYLSDLFIFQKERCAISGVELSFGSVGVLFTKNASLDRIDNTKGYIKGNVQWVHKDVNLMKHIHSLSDFVEICKIITEHQFNVKIQNGRCDLCKEKWNSDSVSRF